MTTTTSMTGATTGDRDDDVDDDDDLSSPFSRSDDCRRKCRLISQLSSPTRSSSVTQPSSVSVFFSSPAAAGDEAPPVFSEGLSEDGVAGEVGQNAEEFLLCDAGVWEVLYEGLDEDAEVDLGHHHPHRPAALAAPGSVLLQPRDRHSTSFDLLVVEGPGDVIQSLLRRALLEVLPELFLKLST
jgi:hypothetical protein